ncbi:MAG: hypothetical protein WBH03_23040 [Cyclobacteriaceae bacterium]
MKKKHKLEDLRITSFKTGLMNVKGGKMATEEPCNYTNDAACDTGGGSMQFNCTQTDLPQVGHQI